MSAPLSCLLEKKNGFTYEYFHGVSPNPRLLHILPSLHSRLSIGVLRPHGVPWFFSRARGALGLVQSNGQSAIVGSGGSSLFAVFTLQSSTVVEGREGNGGFKAGAAVRL